jgi:phage terminase small subunit
MVLKSPLRADDMPAHGLSAKQARFVDEYLRCGNATRAAVAAGYSEKTAAEAGCLNLRKPNIAAAIAARQAERTERTKIDIDYVLQRLAIEAEREGEGSSHSARVAALGHLRNHFAAVPIEQDEAKSLTINISAAAPVGEIRVTRPGS